MHRPKAKRSCRILKHSNPNPIAMYKLYVSVSLPVQKKKRFLFPFLPVEADLREFNSSRVPLLFMLALSSFRSRFEIYGAADSPIETS